MKSKNTNYKNFTPLLAAIPAFALGAIWYSTYCFEAMWKTAKENSFTPPTPETMPYMSMAVSFVAMVVMAYGLRWLMKRAKVPANYMAGAQFGLMIGLFFVATTLGIIYAYSGNKDALTLWGIDASYQVLFMTIMGTILAQW